MASMEPQILHRAASVPEKPRVAVLFQAIDSPVINGARKPRKPGGYQDSGADIAFVLQRQCEVDVITPSPDPDPKDDQGWCFPDNEGGILSAIQKGATHLWANTILFASHPLQTSSRLEEYQKKVLVVGQPPLLVERFDDKEYTNNLLRSNGSFTLPRAWSVKQTNDLKSFLETNKVPYPIVGKPIRGRGSHGVKVCHTIGEICQHVQQLSKESPVMLEEYLTGEEVTVTVMPPSAGMSKHWAMPIVVRFNHQEGITPYSGVTAVTENSKALSPHEAGRNVRYAEVARECELVAELLSTTAPIRVDARRFDNSPDSKFALFDINMKPNLTGPGRPGRENQASLPALSASALGWNYPMLLCHLLNCGRSLEELRKAKPVYAKR